MTASQLWCEACQVALRTKSGTVPADGALPCPRCGEPLKVRRPRSATGGERPAAASRRVQPVEPAASPPAPKRRPAEETNPKSPAPLAAAPASRKPQTQTELVRGVIAAFEGQTVRRRPTFGYLCAVLLTLCGLCVIAALYLAAIAGVGWGLWSYVTHMIAGPTGPRSFNRFVLAMHAGVLVTGGLFLFSLVAPWFSFRSRPLPGRPVPLGEAALLHSFVGKLCEVIRTPAPVQIRLMSEPNACVIVQGGLLGVLRRRLILCIGTPLIAGMKLQNLTGVIAHELGHFSQDAGRGVSYFVGTFVDWLVQGMSINESVSESLTDGDEGELAIVSLFRLVVAIASFFGLLVLRIFTLLCHFVCMFLSRHQEYDADRYEAEVAGSQAFRRTTLRLHELGLGYARASLRMASGDCPELHLKSFADWAVEEARQLSKEQRQTFHEEILRQRTGLFDTHPCDADRIAAAEASAQPGLFHLDAPARMLCPNFDDLAFQVSPKRFRNLRKNTEGFSIRHGWGSP